MRLALLFLCALVPLAASAEVRIEPHFGHPYIFADHIVFTSVDGTRLIAIDKQGSLRWETAFPERIFVQRAGEQLMVQSGRHVYKIDSASGAKSEVFVMPEHEVLIADVAENFLAAGDTRFDHKRLRILDPLDFSVAWESSEIESIVDVNPAALIAVTAERKYATDPPSYQLTNPALRSFDRKTGASRWAMPLDEAYIESARVGNFLVLIERLPVYDPAIGDHRLRVLDPDTGAVLSQRVGNFRDLWPMDDVLAVAETAGSAGEAEFYTCTLPECRKQSAVSLVAKEILRVRVHRDYIITAGIYDSACFDRATGTRLWQKGQLEWSQPFDEQMVITDYSRRDRSARIVSIDLKTGKERVLFSRLVTEQERANFRPW